MIYNFVCKDITGALVHFSQFKGKVLLIVNTASNCALSTQYHELEELYENYKLQGFEVIAFPCNQFARQEPGSPEDIRRHVKEKYGVTFPIMEKSNVNGHSTNALFDYLKKACPGFFMDKVKWNFTKFLVNRDGTPVKRYGPTRTPLSIEKDIIAELNKGIAYSFCCKHTLVKDYAFYLFPS